MVPTIDQSPETTKFDAVFAGLWALGGDSGVDGWLTVTNRRILFRPRGVAGTWGSLVGGLVVALGVTVLAALIVPALMDAFWALVALAMVAFVAAYRWLGRKFAKPPAETIPMETVTRIGTAPRPFATIALEIVTAGGNRYLARAVNLDALRGALSGDETPRPA